MLRNTTIYLNNTAVTLLGTYNNYVAAIQTMKDALELLSKSINMTSASGSSHNGNSSNSSNNNSASDMANMEALHQLVIQNASHRIQIESQRRQQQNETTNPILPEPQSQQHDNHSTIGVTHHQRDEGIPQMNDIGVVVLPSDYNPKEAYHLLATIRTSKAAIRIVGEAKYQHNSQNNCGNNDVDYYMNLHVVRSILVYNYGIAHRCCIPAPAPAPANTTNGDHDSHPNHSTVNTNKVGTFCLQIFQYAEQLLLPALESNSAASIDPEEVHDSPVLGHDSASALSSAPNNYLLLYRFVLTRNLMMISCKMGMLLCELYKQTLDPIENEILLLQSQPTELNGSISTNEPNHDTWDCNNDINNNASAA
jgi:hypothetical protein